jgi:thiamine pyrophosphate-dependent acetolactate synthase large subunit-like protein
VTVVVFDNSSLAWSRHYNRRFYGFDGATDFLDVDYAAVARGLRCDGVRVSAVDDFGAALDSAAASGTTTVIDARIDPEARPPVDMFD